jgi:uncharacterized protein YoaH (UPF0181 family)
MITFNRIAAVALLVTTSLGSWAAGEATTPGIWEKVKTFTHQQQKEAVAEGKKLMAATDKQIATLSKQVKSSTGEVKAEHEKNMKELKAKKDEAQVQLDKLGKATSNVWDATKEGFANAGKDLHAAYEKAAASAKK